MTANDGSKNQVTTKIIESVELDNLVVVPQCIDNQFVPENLFGRMVKSGRSLNDIMLTVMRQNCDDPAVLSRDIDAQELWEAQKSEYNRALLYSRQIVVNRAAFWNSPVLVSGCNSGEAEKIAELLRTKVIVPFLFNESEFGESPKNFPTIYGEDALKHLLEILSSVSVDPISCVRLKTDSENNKKETGKMTRRFRQELSGIYLSGNDQDEMLDNLSKTLLGNTATRSDQEEFKGNILELSKSIVRLLEDRNNQVNRTDVYERWISKPGTPTSEGIYREGKHVFALKKWIDAIYNANLPESIGALTFVPKGFPTAFDLGVSWKFDNKNSEIIASEDAVFEEVLDRAKNKETWVVWNGFQKEADLVIPAPHELSHEDILTIREWKAWKEMMNNLELYLQLKVNSKTMLESYIHFNEVLQVWWLQHKANISGRAETFSVGIGRIYQIGKFMFGLLSTSKGVIPILPAQNVPLPDLDADTTRWGLEVGLFAIGKAGIDWKRSQLFQRMSTQMKVDTSDIRNMVVEISRLFPEYTNRLPRIKPSDLPEAEG